MVHEKLKELNMILGTVAFWLFDKNTQSSTFWVANDLQHEDLVSLPYDEKIMNENTCLRDSWEAKITEKDIINKKYSKEQTNKYFEYVFANNSLSVVPAHVREFVRQAESQIMCLFVEKIPLCMQIVGMANTLAMK